MNDYYVYGHYTEDSDVLFYVGKGRGIRSHKAHNRSKEWFALVKNFGGFKVRFLHENLSEDEAIVFENWYLTHPDSRWQLVNKVGAVERNVYKLEMVKDLVYYSETSPSGLRWKEARASNALKDSVAGAYSATGWAFKINGKRTATARIVAILHGMEIDGLVIDHIDGNTNNNKVSNLRAISSKHNACNTKKRKDNTSGVHGVSFHAKKKAWVAQWSELNGQRGQKWFAISKHGLLPAFALAYQWREQKIKELNEQGAGYTERHGK
jgi:hypothetical protein